MLLLLFGMIAEPLLELGTIGFLFIPFNVIVRKPKQIPRDYITDQAVSDGPVHV